MEHHRDANHTTDVRRTRERGPYLGVIALQVLIKHKVGGSLYSSSLGDWTPWEVGSQQTHMRPEHHTVLRRRVQRKSHYHYLP